MTEIRNIKPNVLYVDDSEPNLTLFKALFKNDYNVVLAKSGTECMNILQENEFEVLVTDQRMPEMSGTELLEIVSVKYPGTMRFILTAYTDFQTVIDGVNNGKIYGYFNKPIEADEVRIAINNAIEVYKLRKHNQQILKKLELANKELLELDSIKTEILKMISTEIRTPLNRIMGTLHLLKDKIESQELIQVVNILDSSVSKLEDFSSMAELISILRSPGHSLKADEVKIKQIIEYGWIETKEDIQAKSIRLEVQNDVGETVISGEYHLIVNCLVNLIKYGIGHTSKGETMTIRTIINHDEIYCEVIDGGKDYTRELIKELENQFSGNRKRLNLNFGIELGLAQMIMEAHQGSLRFRMTEDQRGSVSILFRISEPS